jgi:hypothetical protein
VCLTNTSFLFTKYQVKTKPNLQVGQIPQGNPLHQNGQGANLEIIEEHGFE